jgi:pimeloyl-ACP methyl ester carboxylesterase
MVNAATIEPKESATWRAEYPFAPHWQDCDGHRLHYVDEPANREPQTASPLLCLHGNPTWSFLYRKVIAEFARTHRVVAPDHMGCGLSDKPQSYPYTLKQHIDNAERLVDSLSLRDITLCVHDWGGAIGFGLAARRPELIKRFVVFNTAAFTSSRIPLSISASAAFRALVRWRFAASTRLCAVRSRAARSKA